MEMNAYLVVAVCVVGISSIAGQFFIVITFIFNKHLRSHPAPLIVAISLAGLSFAYSFFIFNITLYQLIHNSFHFVWYYLMFGL
jgi:hypothetical protein